MFQPGFVILRGTKDLLFCVGTGTGTGKDLWWESERSFACWLRMTMMETVPLSSRKNHALNQETEVLRRLGQDDNDHKLSFLTGGLGCPGWCFCSAYPVSAKLVSRLI